MKRFILFLGALAIITLVGMTAAMAQRGPGPGAGPQAGLAFDPKTVETLKGEVTKVDRSTPARRGAKEVRLIVKTDKETLPVILGPDWYVDKQGVALAAGDQVEVKGSRVMLEGKPAVIAASVKKGDKTLNLRNDQGIPAWAGPRRS